MKRQGCIGSILCILITVCTWELSFSFLTRLFWESCSVSAAAQQNKLQWPDHRHWTKVRKAQCSTKPFPPRIISTAAAAAPYSWKDPQKTGLDSIIFYCGRSGNVIFTAALHWIESLANNVICDYYRGLHPRGSDSYQTKKSTVFQLTLSSSVKSCTVWIDRALSVL